MKITISGTAGAGKSTLAKMLAEKFGLKHYSTGDFMRQIARDRNLTLEDIGKIAEGDRSIDTTLDKRQLEIGKGDGFVIDGRISFKFIPDSIKIFIDCDLKVRAERIWRDIKVKGLRKEEDADSLREIIDEIKEREASEKKRYKEYYGVDPYDRTNYDFVLDTTYTTAAEALQKIVEFVENTNSQQ